MGIIFLAIYTFLLLAFVPAEWTLKAQTWAKSVVAAIKKKLDN